MLILSTPAEVMAGGGPGAIFSSSCDTGSLIIPGEGCARRASNGERGSGVCGGRDGEVPVRLARPEQPRYG